MSDKAFASLTSGLLARKGQARPAMRPQGFSMGFGHPEDLGWNDMGYSEADQEPRRLNGPRLPVSLSGPHPVMPVGVAANADVPVVVRQINEIAREMGASKDAAETPIASAPVAAGVAVGTTPPAARRSTKAPVRGARRAVQGAAKPVVPSLGGRKSAFTLRLDVERHLHLRLACAVQNRSAQQLLIEALDGLLDQLPDVARLAASLPDQSAADPSARLA
jgi:hypothetical protein